jgi:hypothetical protein
MLRGKTTRFLFMLVATALLALQLFAPTASFASAHTFHSPAAKVPAVTKTGARNETASEVSDEISARIAAETVTCGDADHSGGPTGPLRTRDRHRAVVDSPTEPPLLVPLECDTAVDPGAAGAVRYRTSRSSIAHSPAALQVFRC